MSSQPSAETAHRRFERETAGLVRRLLGSGAVARPKWWVSQRGRFGLFIAALTACGIASVVYQVWVSGLNPQQSGLPDGARLATALVAATAAGFAYYQWIDSRREASLDKYYERVGLLNDTYCVSKDARDLVFHFWGDSVEESNTEFQKRHYVYLELDNLEYILARFQLGFVSDYVFERAIGAFRARCESREFSDLARELVGGAGYHEETAMTVALLVASAQNPTV